MTEDTDRRPNDPSLHPDNWEARIAIEQGFTHGFRRRFNNYPSAFQAFTASWSVQRVALEIDARLESIADRIADRILERLNDED